MSNAFKKCVEIWSVWDLWKATCNWYRQYCYIEYHTSCRWHKALHWAWMLNRGQVLWDCWYTASMRREIATVGWRGEQPRNLWYIRLSFGNLWKLQGCREAHLRPAYCELLNMNLVKWKKKLTEYINELNILKGYIVSIITHQFIFAWKTCHVIATILGVIF